MFQDSPPRAPCRCRHYMYPLMGSLGCAHLDLRACLVYPKIFFLTRSNARHIIMLGQGGQVFVEFLHTFFVGFDSFALETFFELLFCF